MEAIAGLTAQQAVWKPAPESNSIWQIVEHLAAAKEWQIDMIEKGQATAADWTHPLGDEQSWQALVARLEHTHARLKVVLGQLHDEDLLTYPVPELDRTLLELILSSGSAHEAHHSGQIDYLKGLQGA